MKQKAEIEALAKDIFMVIRDSFDEHGLPMAAEYEIGDVQDKALCRAIARWVWWVYERPIEKVDE